MKRNRSSSDRKALQLCRQVQRALSYALGDCGDDVLGGLFVESVQPAPNAGHLLVTVSSMDADVAPADVMQRLGFVAGKLRGDISSAINRKRTPELSFQCIANPPAEVPPPEETD